MVKELKIILLLILLMIPLSLISESKYTLIDGGIVRGFQSKRELSLIFSGGNHGAGLGHILDVLSKHKIKGSFFLTGTLFKKKNYRSLLKRIVDEGHYLGPHSYDHLLLASWDDKKTLVSKKIFTKDLKKNIRIIEKVGFPKDKIKYWLPPFEHYNPEIAQWSRDLGVATIGFTRGTKTHTDWIPEGEKGYLSSDEIFESVLNFDKRSNMNGFLLLSHIGTTDKRKDKFYLKLDALIEYLKKQGYKLVRVDELLK